VILLGEFTLIGNFLVDEDAWGIPWIVMIFIADLIMFPIALLLTIIFRCKKEEVEESDFTSVRRKGYALWTAIGLLITYTVFVICLYFCYVWSEELSENDNEWWLAMFAINLIIEMILMQLIKIVFKAILVKSLGKGTGSLSQLIRDI
jgi:hypothetical protein